MAGAKEEKIHYDLGYNTKGRLGTHMLPALQPKRNY